MRPGIRSLRRPSARLAIIALMLASYLLLGTRTAWALVLWASAPVHACGMGSCGCDHEHGPETMDCCPMAASAHDAHGAHGHGTEDAPRGAGLWDLRCKGPGSGTEGSLSKPASHLPAIEDESFARAEPVDVLSDRHHKALSAPEEPILKVPIATR